MLMALIVEILILLNSFFFASVTTIGSWIDWNTSLVTLLKGTDGLFLLPRSAAGQSCDAQQIVEAHLDGGQRRREPGSNCHRRFHPGVWPGAGLWTVQRKGLNPGCAGGDVPDEGGIPQGWSARTSPSSATGTCVRLFIRYGVFIGFGWFGSEAWAK